MKNIPSSLRRSGSIKVASSFAATGSRTRISSMPCSQSKKPLLLTWPRVSTWALLPSYRAMMGPTVTPLGRTVRSSSPSSIRSEGRPYRHVETWVRLPRRVQPPEWANIDHPVCLLERNLYGHPLAGLLQGALRRR